MNSRTNINGRRFFGWPHSAYEAILALAILMIASVGTAYLLRDTIYAFGADVIHHTALAEALRHVVVLPEASRGFLGEMFYYPSFSHRIASVWLNLGADPINALNLTAIGSVAALWLVLLTLVEQASRIALVLFAALSLVAIRTLSPGMLVGHEIISNFFYAQTVGDCVFLVAAVALLMIASSEGGWACLAFGVIGIFVTAQFHLLAGMRLTLVAMLALALIAYRRRTRERTLDNAALVGLIALPASLALNPSFAAMRKIAEHEGVLNFALPVSASTLLVTSMLVIAGAATGIARQLHAEREPPVTAAPQASDCPERPIEPRANTMEAAQFIYLIAGGVALGAAAQALLFMLFDMGSGYAVKKHTFGVLTLGLAAFSVIVGQRLEVRRSSPIRQRSLTRSAVIIVGAYALLISALFIRPSVVDVARLIQLWRNVVSTKAEIADAKQVGTPLFISSSLPPVVNYYVTVALFNSPRDANAYGILESYRITDLDKISYVVTEAGDNTFDRPACASHRRSGALAILATSCFEMASPVERGLSLYQVVHFAAGGRGTQYLKSGWSQPESWGIWSIDEVAVLAVPVAENFPRERFALELVAQAFVPPQSPTRAVRVSVNGASPTSITFTQDKPVLTTTIPVDVLEDARVLEIKFAIAQPVSPAQFGLSGDPRALGVGIRSLRLVRRAL